MHCEKPPFIFNLKRFLKVSPIYVKTLLQNSFMKIFINLKSRLFNVAIAQAIADEQERVAQEEKEAVKLKQTEDEEDKVPNLETSGTTGGIGNELTVDEHLEEHSIHDVSDQDYEAIPYEVDHDDDTQVRIQQKYTETNFRFGLTKNVQSKKVSISKQIQ